MDPDNLVLVLYEKFSGDMEISGGNKYRFKCYQFLEYPVSSFPSSKKFQKVNQLFGIFWNFWTALYILIKGTGYVFILLCFGPHAHSNMIALGLMYILNSIVCVESCYRHY